MVDLYNKEDKAGKIQQLQARFAHLSDEECRLQKELKEVKLEKERVKFESDFGDQAGD
ncbi:hypothetical protein [Pseudoalteromonas phage PH357]|nr:hypothetical protein [Pseudoalteromonas phage PH357]